MNTNIKYRVILKVGYYETYFEFESSDQACNFAANALSHMVTSEDTKKKTSINIQVIDADADAKEDDDD